MPSAKSSMFSAPELGADAGDTDTNRHLGTFSGASSGYGAAADVYSWGLTVLAMWCDDGGDARATVRAVRDASLAGTARGESGWGVGGGGRGSSLGDGMMLPNRWGRRCPFPGTLRDVVARTVRLDPEARPSADEIVKTLLGARG